MKYPALTAMILITLLSSCTLQQAKPNNTGLPITLDNNLDQIQQAFQTKSKATPRTAPNKGDSLHIGNKGVWVALSTSGDAEAIRFDAPYSGSVFGVKIGDTLPALKKLYGEPIKTFFRPAYIEQVGKTYFHYAVPTRDPLMFEAKQAIYYSLEQQNAVLRFDINDDEEIESIIFAKRNVF